ncbi:microsomal triglyceride transfer protein-like [Ascaphus truei]|uniref:microsomal triglyceride transfer protein-like n=1 Tax=Ascaphus truei TaxID=8439 RepID=UPI003F59DE8B
MTLQAVVGMSCWGLLLLLISCSAQESPSFQPGILYRYDYTLDLTVEHASQPAMPGSRLKAEAAVQTYLLWRNKIHPDEQLVHVQIQDFAIQNFPSRRTSNVSVEDSSIKHPIDAGSSSNLERPIVFHWNSGKVVGMYVTGEGNDQMLDLKRGLVSLFQFQPLSGMHKEDDVSGRCLVTYDMSKNLIKKTRDLHRCTHAPFGFTADYKVLGLFWNSTSKSSLILNSSIIQTAVSEESHVVSLRVKSILGSQIASRQELEFKSSLPGPAEIPGESVQKILEALPEKFQKVEIASHPLRRTDRSQLLKNYLSKSKGRVAKLDISKVSTTKHFNTFVKMLRHAKKLDILQLLKKSSGELVPFFIDAAVASQSPASLAALSEFLDFTKKKQVPLQEKFLYAAAFAPHPTKELLNIVLEKLKGKISDPGIMETGLLVTGTIVGKLCRMKRCDLEEVEFAKATLVEGLQGAEDRAEIKMYLLSLKNAQLPETIPLLLQYAEENSGEVSSAALSALTSFPTEYISTRAVKKTLRRLVHQEHQTYDKTSRLIAAETLLAASSSPMDLINILLALEYMDTEASKLLLSRLLNSLHSKRASMKAVKDILKDMRLNNYSKFSRSSTSTAFSGLLAATKDMVSTYGLDLLFTESGLLKRSVSDFTLFSHGHHLKTMQVSIEAHGLESLLGDGVEEEGDDDTEASVGMSAILFDVQLRPVVFFKGYMDLVSKVLASSGEPTSVVKGNVLLVDHLQWLPMQSGLQVIIEYQCGLGLEILANIDVNIWEQESKTNIKTKAGLVMEFRTEVDTSFFQANVMAQVDAETTLSFDTVMKLSGTPLPMCLQLKQEDLPYRETYILTESFPEKNITHTVRRGRKDTLWGRDFPLHSANSEMCKSLLAENEQ